MLLCTPEYKLPMRAARKTLVVPKKHVCVLFRDKFLSESKAKIVRPNGVNRSL